MRRYDALIRVQGETLDNLAEAVAVFGSDGRLRLHNPAFADHVAADAGGARRTAAHRNRDRRCRPLYDDDALWQRLRATVTAIEGRESVKGRLELRNGSVADLVTVPLPDGATLVAFLDVTDTINVERALRERNEALETADALKVDFVHHVSYELRSPLTNIIGFAQLMGEPSLGALNPKQREYLGYINTSTNALLAIINDILDLATIDAGAMKLNLGPVDIRRHHERRGRGHPRPADQGRHRRSTSAPRPTSAASPPTSAASGRSCSTCSPTRSASRRPAPTITLSAERRPDAIVFSVTDNGPGIPPEVQDRVFDWFEIAFAGLAPSRRRPRPVDRALLRRTARRHGDAQTPRSARAPRWYAASRSSSTPSARRPN